MPLTVNGDGSDGLDFTYIGDLVQAIRLCVEKPEARNQVFNTTYGSARSLNQMIEIMRGHFPNIEVKYQARDGLMPERGTLSVEKARRLLGYSPQFALDQGFVRYIEWYKGLASRHPEYFKQA